MMVSSQTQALGPPPIVSVGQLVDGKYRVDRIIGSGGMGVVVGATHVRLEEPVAIKVLRPEAAQSANTVERFLREARAAVKIKSEHVVRVLDVGTLESGLPFMVMERLEGHDLADELRERGPLPVTAAVDAVLQACDALAEAHAAGIVHRDLKPANLFLTRRADGSPCIKVLDFGISKILSGASDHAVTRTTALMGSPLYMSPEQMRSARDVDERTDIWSLGVILHELLTGTAPFSAESLAQLCVIVIESPPPSAHAARPEVPAGLDGVILRCLEKRPENRYPDVGELAAALAPFASPWGRVVAARVASVAAARTVGSRPPPASDFSVARTLEMTPAGQTQALTLPAPAPAITAPPTLSPTLGGSALPSVPPPKPSHAGRTAAVLAGIAVAVLAGALVLGYILFGSGRGPTTASPVDGGDSRSAAVSAPSASQAEVAPAGEVAPGTAHSANSNAPPNKVAPTASAQATRPPAPTGKPSASAKGPDAPPRATAASQKRPPVTGGDIELPAPQGGF